MWRRTARCEVMGRHYYLSDSDTAFIPRGHPHRFINDSKEMMAMLWVYGGDEPTRELVRTHLERLWGHEVVLAETDGND